MSPTIYFGDLVVVTPPDVTISAGSVIMMNVDGDLVTHRLIMKYQGGMPITKGDANNTPDIFTGSNLKIVGVIQLRIPLLGYPILYARFLIGKVLAFIGRG